MDMTVVMTTASMVAPMRASRDVQIQVIGVFEVVMIVNMMVLGMEAVQGVGRRVGLGLLERVREELWGREMRLVAFRIVWAGSQHLEDVGWINLSRHWVMLVVEHALKIFLKIIAFEMIRDILVTV